MTTQKDVRGIVALVSSALQRALSGRPLSKPVQLAAQFGDVNAMIEVEAYRIVQEDFGSFGPMEDGYTVVLERKPEKS